MAKGAGAAILKDIPKMVRLTESVVKAVSLPVTVKTRLGWEEADKPIVQVAEMLQDVGVQMLSIHGRTRSQICHKGGVICISEVIDISPGNFDSSLCFIQPGISHDVLGSIPEEV